MFLKIPLKDPPQYCIVSSFLLIFLLLCDFISHTVLQCCSAGLPTLHMLQCEYSVFMGPVLF